MSFEIIDNTEAARSWNTLLQNFQGYNIYQSFGWGESKARSGWKVLRLVFKDSGEIKGLGEGFFKESSLLNLKFFWFPGGVVSERNCYEEVFTDFLSFLKGRSEKKNLYLRLKFAYPKDDEMLIALRKTGFSELKSGVGSDMTFRVDTQLKMEELEDNLTSNWRHNLSRAQKRENIFFEDTSWKGIEQFYSYYRDFCSHRRIKNRFSRKEIFDWFDIFSKEKNLHIFFTKNGEDLTAGRLILNIGKRAFDMLAFTTNKGRSQYSSYCLVWEIIHWCHENNFEFFDLSGININKFESIYNFKKGLGGEQVHYGGEWEFSSNLLLRPLVSFYSFLRKD